MSTNPNPEVLPAGEPSTALAMPAAPPAPSARALTLATAFNGMIPQSIGEAVQLAEFLAKSEAIPSSMRKNPATVLTVMMTGMEVGLTPLQAVNNITNISGNLGMKGNLMLALVQRSGLLLHWDEGWNDSDEVPDKHFGWCEVIRKGDVHARAGTYPWNGEAYQVGDHVVRRKHFSRAMARKVKVKEHDKWIPMSEKGTYIEWPERMYPMRARTWNLEMVFGDVLKGLTSTENIEGGQVLDAEVVSQHTETQGDTADAILADIRDSNALLATSIESGFDLLQMPNGRRLQMLTQYRKDPEGLAVALRDEWGRRKGKGDVGTAKADAAKATVLEAVGAPVDKPATVSDPVAATTTPDPQAPADDRSVQDAAAAARDDVDDAMPTTTATPAEDAAMVERQATIADAIKADAMTDTVVAKAPALSGLARAAAIRRRSL